MVRVILEIRLGIGDVCWMIWLVRWIRKTFRIEMERP